MTNSNTGGGMHAGLSSGKIAAKYTIEALKSGNYEIMAEYDKKINKTSFLNQINLKTTQYFKEWTNDDCIFLEMLQEEWKWMI